jgi:hypothetical protein
METVITEFNLTFGKKQNVRLELVKWENNARPGIGADGQDVINQQIQDDYDIFVGMMWSRFGSPTARSESGTKEEFERAFARFKENSKSVTIMFYFKDAPIPPSKIDLDQLGKVQAFKQELSEKYGALYSEFETPEDFLAKIRIHLGQLIHDGLEINSVETVSEVQAITLHNAQLATAPILTTLDDNFEDGMFELSDAANEAMENVARIANHMSEIITDLGDKATKRTAEINSARAGGNIPGRSFSKHIVDSAAEDLEFFAQRLSVDASEFSKEHSRAMENFGKVAMLANSDFNEPTTSFEQTLSSLSSTRTVILTSKDQLQDLMTAIVQTPRMTTAYNRARKRAASVIDDLISQFRIAAQQTQAVEHLLQRIIDERS